MMWYPRGRKRQEKRPNLGWDHNIRKQVYITWSRKARDRGTLVQMKNDYVKEATPSLEMVENADNDDFLVDYLIIENPTVL